MLKGQVFAEQTFTSDCFAHFIYTFLDKHNGVTKGCNLSNTANSVTVGEGYFVVFGRFLQEIGGTTLNVASATEYCKLVCEIDLSKINTETSFLQASWKILKSSLGYPTLIQQDLENGGNIFQFEFAKFQNTTSGITNFVDTREFVSIDSIYTLIQAYIADLEAQSTVVFKEEGKGLSTNDYTDVEKTKLAGIGEGATKNEIAVLNGQVTLIANTSANLDLKQQQQTQWLLDFPAGFNKDNCVCIAFGGMFYNDGRGYSYARAEEFSSVNMVNGDIPRTITLGASSSSTKINCQAYNMATSDRVFYYRIVLMKIA